MKSFDNTVPFVLLELVVGAIFILVILIAIPLLSERVNTLALPSLSPETPIQQPKDVSPAIQSALETLNSRVATLLASRKKDLATAVMVQPPREVADLVEYHLQPIFSRFADLDAVLVSRISGLNDPLMVRLQELDDKVESIFRERQKYFYPLLAELNKKTDSMLLEHKTAISPALDRLNSEINALFRELGHVVERPPVQLIDSGSEDDSSVEIEIVDVDVDMPQEELPDSPAPSIPSTSRVPVLVKGANKQVLRSIQDVLAEYQLKSNIGPGGGSLLLTDFFDFRRFADTLNEEQVAKLGRLADALAEILPCYSKSSDALVMEKCREGRSPVGLDIVLVQSFSLGGNIGTLRVNYNSRLANTRSVYILKTLVTARPDLLKFFNSRGSPVFDAVGKLAPSDDERSRRIVLQFIMEKPSGG